MNNKYQILLVEDDKEVAKMLVDTISQERSFNITVSHTFKSAYRLLQLESYHIVVLDLLLPDGYGLDLIHHIDNNITHVIVLSKSNDFETRINSYKNGIDSFLGKPFYPEELLILTKKSLHLLKTSIIYTDKNILINTTKRYLKFKEDIIDLTKTETIILQTLIESPNRTASKLSLTSAISRKTDKPYNEKRLAVSITRLRNKLKRYNIVLKSHYGIGYIIKFPNPTDPF